MRVLLLLLMLMSTSTAYNTARILRVKLRKIQCGRCSGCNAKFSRRVPAELHHIDHNRKNNAASNLIVCCSNCHVAWHRYGEPLDRVWKLEKKFSS